MGERMEQTIRLAKQTDESEYWLSHAVYDDDELITTKRINWHRTNYTCFFLEMINARRKQLNLKL
jgi:hypothetical protein